MGMHYLVSISDDAIRDARSDPEEWAAVRAELGEGAMQLCLGPTRHVDGRGQRTAGGIMPVRDDQAGIVFWGEVHTLEQQVYLWSRGRLQTPERMSDDELDRAALLIIEERMKRPSATN